MSLLAKVVLWFASFAAIAACIFVVRRGRAQEEMIEQSPELGEFFDELGTLTQKNDSYETADPEQESSMMPVDSTLHEEEKIMTASKLQDTILMVHVFAKDNKQFVGYELLQAILAAGLRFGEMDIFHRYQSLSGKGPILFSLACATEPGTFEMQKMGGFSCSGLSLFLRLSNNPTIDNERFELLLETAEQLKDDLDGELRSHDYTTLSARQIDAYKQQILMQGEESPARTESATA